ncbi:MAG: 1-acyl-sn-glycerol-3-phosphate acyltransferase [Ignavibacteria bacterium]|nr:1-acyl-sn-glycerol-3-phosphate acyltransferase [Ignavibacteria bacterium]
MMIVILGVLRFLLITLLCGVFACTAILVIPFDRGGRLFHANARTWARVVLFVGGIRVSVLGLDKVPFTRNYVYVANHASMFDIPAIIAGIPDQIRIVYKKELEWVPLFGWGLRWGSYIGIDRTGGSRALVSLEEAAKRIRDGASVLLYAEGTRTIDGRLQPFKRGAFHLAARAGVPVIPLTVNGTFPILKKHSMVVRPGDVELVLDRPIPFTGSDKQTEQKLMEDVHNVLSSNYRNQEE